MSPHALGIVLLVFVTVVWGSTFPIVKGATDTLAPATLLAWRFTLAMVVLVPFLLRTTRLLWRDGFVLGVWLTIGYASQTLGLQTTSANRAAFITGLSVVLVPLWLAGTAKQKLSVRLWGAAFFALAGIGLLSWEGGALVIGDAWVLLCALSYAGYILALEKLAAEHASLQLTAVQVAATGLLCWAWAIFSGGAIVPSGADQWLPLLYLGLVATAFTTFLQTVGQRRVTAPEAAIIYALEPVTASVFSFLLLKERVGLRGLAGGALVVLAMVLSQLPDKTDKRAKVRDHGLAE
ncbi:DMT family transporter [Deinococcus yavapaiensis]|uniref:Threonine/homoserine efflux transporter RhtA n=1 Tax=Deinococcus yavapaiensis KR-236 TaxID=694435 RepID=A0A318S9A9_9DEIO|nr:DMT family transporter [Deinococcus yavapaiensis]PYE55801.1 threonine/homoserine efflux transporter RhtA [Deinococcus yavapaiensis KR-236]